MLADVRKFRSQPVAQGGLQVIQSICLNSPATAASVGVRAPPTKPARALRKPASRCRAKVEPTATVQQATGGDSVDAQRHARQSNALIACRRSGTWPRKTALRLPDSTPGAQALSADGATGRPAGRVYPDAATYARLFPAICAPVPVSRTGMRRSAPAAAERDAAGAPVPIPFLVAGRNDDRRHFLQQTPTINAGLPVTMCPHRSA